LGELENNKNSISEGRLIFRLAKMPGSQILKDFTDFRRRREAESSIRIQEGPRPEGIESFVTSRMNMVPLEMFANAGSFPTISGSFAVDETKQLSLIERIERALVVLAYLVERDGDVYVPLYEKFEAELQELKAREDTKSRARRRLEAYSEAGALKAIC
jgi:hypothetical protein